MPTDQTPPARPSQVIERYTAFAKAFIANGFNAKQAAISAGYSPRSASQQASELLDVPKVQALIRALQAEALEKTPEATPARVMQELAALGFSDLGDVAEWGTDDEGEDFVSLNPSKSLPDHVRRSISEISRGEKGTLKVKQHGKIEALRLLAQHFGMLQPENQAALAVTFVIEGGPPLRRAD